MAKRHLTRERILDRARAAYRFPDGSRFPTRAEEAAANARFEQVLRMLLIKLVSETVQNGDWRLARNMLRGRTKTDHLEALAGIFYCCRTEVVPTEVQVYLAAMLLPTVAPWLDYKIEAGPPRAGHRHPLRPPPLAPSYDQLCTLAEGAEEGSAMDQLADWFFKLLEQRPAPAVGRSREYGRTYWKAWMDMRPPMELPDPEDWPERLDLERQIIRCAARYLGVPEKEIRGLFVAARAKRHYYNPAPRRRTRA